METTLIGRDTLLDAEIRKHRIKNLSRLSQLRILTVSLFFMLHLIGGMLKITTFRDKEIYFSVYLLAALMIAALTSVTRRAERHSAEMPKLGAPAGDARSLKIRLAEFLGLYSIPLVDLPMAYVILRAWSIDVLDVRSLHHMGVLAMSVMMYFVTLSGLFFSRRLTIPTTLVAIAAVLHLFAATNSSLNSRMTGTVLLILTGYTTIAISGQVKALIGSATKKQLLNEKLSRYFAPEVVQVIQARQTSVVEEQNYDVTILFTDIRDFTKMASSMSGSELIQTLNEIHEHLVACIFKTGGTLDKYLGDGVMAYFGAPVPSDNHADRAVECAMLMRREMIELNEKRKSRGEQAICIGMGIHSGPAFIGDIGAAVRREFTVIGDTVNTSSRIEGLTKRHQVDVLLTAQTKGRLQKSYPLKSLGLDEIRGSGMKTETFTLA